MTDVTIQAGTLHLNAEEGTATGLLVPFGEIAQSNLGRFSVEPGVFEFPEDVTGVSLNVEHVAHDVVGAVTRIWEQPEGLFASFKFAKSAAGQRAWNEVQSGSRKNLSVEATAVTIRNGRATAGRIYGAALVTEGAFAGATLLAAKDTETETAGSVAVGLENASAGLSSEEFREAVRAVAVQLGIDPALLNQTPEAEADSTADDAEDTNAEATAEASAITTPDAPAEQEPEVEQLPDTLHAAASPEPVSAREFFILMDRARAGRATAEQTARIGEAFASRGTFATQSNLYAALSDVTYDAVGAPKPYQDVPQWLGDVYAANPYKQQVADLINHGDLTGKKMAGYRWVNKPVGGTYAGNKAEVPSNAPSTEAFEVAAALWAGAHDIDIQHRLFGDDGYYAAHTAMMIESYKKWVDAKVITDLLAGATGSVTDGGNAAGAGTAITSIVDGALAVVAAGYTPTFALVTPAIYREYILTKENDLPALLSQSAGLEEGSFAGFTVRPTTVNLGTNRNALVGARSAATLYELSGTPIRVEGVDVAHMGDDLGFIGAAAVAVTNPGALVKVTKKSV